MSNRLRIFSIFILLSLVFNCFSQESIKEKDLKKERKFTILEQISGETPNLRLAQNRTYAYAMIGNLFWDLDQKRAYVEFNNSLEELIKAQFEIEEYLKKKSLFSDGYNVRQNILQTIGNRDAELALQYLYNTRNAKISKALENHNQPKNPLSNSSNSSNYFHLAQSEKQLEQSLLTKAADQNPEMAIELLKKSLDSSLTYQTLQLLTKLHKKDPETANSLANDFLDKLSKTKFDRTKQNNYINFTVSKYFLNEFVRQKGQNEKHLILDESKMERLAKNVIDESIKNNRRNKNYRLWGLKPIVKRFFPEMLKSLEENNLFQSQKAYGKYNKEVTKLINSNHSPEVILNSTKKFPAPLKLQIIQNLSNKLVNQGKPDHARKILSENLKGDALKEQLRSIEWNLANNYINQGKFDEALFQVGKLPRNTRLNYMLRIASRVYKKNPVENKDFAKSILNQALELSPQVPEDQNDLRIIMSVITTYLKIDPEESFLLYESLIPIINEQVEATRKHNGFIGTGNVRNNEFLLSSGHPWGLDLHKFSSQAPLFIKADFERTMKLIDSFESQEMRIALKLIIAQYALN